MWKYFIITGIILVHLSGNASFGQEPANDPVDTTWYVPGDINYNLLIAAYLGLDDEVLRFLNQGAYINTTTMSGNSPLLMASGQGHISTVRILVLNGADIEQDNSEGIFPLLQATLSNHIEVAEFLINKGADVNRQDIRGRTALLVSAAYNYVELTDMLLHYGGDINLPDKQGTTPLMAATYAGNIGLAQMLIDQGASVNIADKRGFTPLMVATQVQDTAFVHFLLENQANLFARDKSGNSVLLMAVAVGDTLLTHYYLRLDTLGRFKKDQPVSPVELAHRSNDKPMIKLLYTYGYSRSVKFYFSSFTTGTSALFNTRDLFTGGYAGIMEGFTGITASAGFLFRPAPIRIMTQVTDHYYYQFWEKRFVAYGELSRDFVVLGRFNPARGGISLSLQGGYTFGTGYPGSTTRPEDRLVFSPGTGIFYHRNFWQVKLSYHYFDLETVRLYPHYLSLDISVDFKMKTISPPRKTISWY
ncbi:MAG: hypothetical protein GXO83_06760 [Chlorobi bacterium]|nr:hypothetical protein [Chlorobiota bacterium]